MNSRVDNQRAENTPHNLHTDRDTAGQASPRVATTLRCLEDGVSCDIRKQTHQQSQALSPRIPKGLEPAGGNTVSRRQSVPLPKVDNAKVISQKTLRATLNANRDRIVDTARLAPTPSSWQVVAAEMLASELDLGMLSLLDETSLKREAVMLLRKGLEPEQIDSISNALYDALAHAAGHQFFGDVQMKTRLTLEEVDGRLASGDDLSAALRDGLSVVGPETANELREQLDLRGPPTREQQRALADRLRAVLERRIEKLTRTPDPTALVTDYPGMVAAHAAAHGIGISRRETNLPEQAFDQLEALFAPILPTVLAKRALDTWFNGDVRVSGDSLLADGLRKRCDFDRMLDLSYQLVSEFALGALTNELNDELVDLALDELASRTGHGAVELLGWSAELLAD